MSKKNKQTKKQNLFVIVLQFNFKKNWFEKNRKNVSKILFKKCNYC